jgi:hypothetical protein
MTTAEDETLAKAMDVRAIANAVADAFNSDLLLTAKGLVVVAQSLIHDDPTYRALLGRYMMQVVRELDPHLTARCITRLPRRLN